MPAPIAAPAAAAPAAPAAPATPKNGAHTEAGQPPATDPKVNAKNGEPGAKPGETAAETRQRLKVKLRKLDGPGEEELELDDLEVGRYVQKARVADKQRAADEKARQEWQDKIDAATKDPLAFFRERGVDLMEVAAQEHARQQELAKLDPAQRRIAEQEAEIAAFKAEKAAAAEKAKADAEAAEQKQFVLAEQQLYKQAMAVSGRVPKTPAEAGYLMRLYADVREMAEHAGVPLTGEQLAAAGEKLELQRLSGMTKRLASSPEWRAKNMAALKEMATALAGELDGPALVQLFSPNVATKLARAQLEAFRKSPIPVVADPVPPAPSNAPPRQVRSDGESLMGMLDGLSQR